MITQSQLQALEWAIDEARKSIGGSDPNDYTELERWANEANAVLTLLKMHQPYTVDSYRAEHFPNSTNIYICAVDHTNKCVSVDISVLDTESLRRWLRSDGEKNRLAENTVLIMLGHPTV